MGTDALTFSVCSDKRAGANVTTDALGNVYLVGYTEGNDSIASPVAHQTSFGGGTDAFIVKFSPAGIRLWATFYGGSGFDYAYGVKTDALGNVYMAGFTTSTDSIATAGTYQPNYNAGADAFLVKFNSSGVRQWGTYYGGNDNDRGISTATDASGNVYLAGYTLSMSGIATVGAYQTSNNLQFDAFLVKFDNTGNRIWGTYFGGTDTDILNGVATDASGNVIICGNTKSASGIDSSGFQNIYGGGGDAFIALIGLQQGIFKFGYSYDVTVSKLYNASAGSHELSLGLQLGCHPKKKRFRTIKCPSF